MSKKMNKLVLLSALMIAIIGTIGTVLAADPLTVDLIAGGGNDKSALTVGEVEVTSDEYNLTVIYNITDFDYCLNETHLHVANESKYIPQTKKGNPQPGQFDYSVEHDCITTITYVVPLSDIEISSTGTVCIAAHAAVDETVGETTTYESAWGEGEDFEGKNWAMYFTYTIE
jgi:hypothetical protein